MIVIFCDGSNDIKYKYIGVAVIAFKVNNDKTIKEFLFATKSEFSGSYSNLKICEFFAIKKALQLSQSYPNEKIIIANDNSGNIENVKQLTQGIYKANTEKTCFISNLFLKNSEQLYNPNIEFVHLVRKAYGISLVDLISKKGITQNDIENNEFQNYLKAAIGKKYTTIHPISSIEEFRIKTSSYCQRKPKYIPEFKLLIDKNIKVIKPNVNVSNKKLIPLDSFRTMGTFQSQALQKESQNVEKSPVKTIHEVGGLRISFG